MILQAQGVSTYSPPSLSLHLNHCTQFCRKIVHKVSSSLQLSAPVCSCFCFLQSMPSEMLGKQKHIWILTPDSFMLETYMCGLITNFMIFTLLLQVSLLALGKNGISYKVCNQMGLSSSCYSFRGAEIQYYMQLTVFSFFKKVICIFLVFSTTVQTIGVGLINSA